MKLHYYFTMPFDFLMQAVKILHKDIQTEEDIKLAYDFVMLTEMDTLEKYNKKSLIVSYQSDLELFIDIIKELLSVYEDLEDYEKCQKLLEKKNICENILYQKKLI